MFFKKKKTFASIWDNPNVLKTAKNKEDFPWEEFLDRFVTNREEFWFIYKDCLEINLFPNPDGTVNVEYGRDDTKYEVTQYASTTDFLENARFDGQTFREIWDELR